MLKKIVSNPFVFFPIFTLIVFWPLSTCLFSLKNDALTYYYPVRTLISDALNNNELPLWTPYINMGYPLHADFQSGAWNPVIWIFSFLSKYSLAAFHYELMLYICFAGIGFYYLCREYGMQKSTAIIIAVAYQLSGFMIDSMQFFVCISSACYIPYVFLFFKRLILTKKISESIPAGFFLSLLFTGGYPAIFIITLYLLLAYVIFSFFIDNAKKDFLKKISFPLLITATTFIALSLPAIFSFISHLQFLDRGKNQTLGFVLENSMPPAAMLSIISPFSTTANVSWLQTDPLMRSIYIGIIPLTFLTYTVFNKKNRTTNFFLITAIIMFGLAWGSYFFLRQWAFHILPLLNTFRHPALFRLFGIFCILLAAGFGLDHWQRNNTANKNKHLQGLLLFSGFSLLVVCIFLLFMNANQLIIPSRFNIQFLKKILQQLNFFQRLLLQLPFTLLIITGFYFIINKKKPVYYLVLLSIFDLFVAAQYNMFITVAGAKKFSEVERLMNRNKSLFPLPDSTSIETNSLNSYDSENVSGSTLPFIKKIGRNDYFITPGNLSLQDKFYESDFRNRVFKNPLLYFVDTLITPEEFNLLENGKNTFGIIDKKEGTPLHFNIGKSRIKPLQLSANMITAITDCEQNEKLTYLQNIYPGWKCYIDNKQTPICPINKTFMAVNIPEGNHTVKFIYRPDAIIYSWYFSCFAYICVILILLQRLFINRTVFPGNHYN